MYPLKAYNLIKLTNLSFQWFLQYDSQSFEQSHFKQQSIIFKTLYLSSDMTDPLILESRQEDTNISL